MLAANLVPPVQSLKIQTPAQPCSQQVSNGQAMWPFASNWQEQLFAVFHPLQDWCQDDKIARHVRWMTLLRQAALLHNNAKSRLHHEHGANAMSHQPQAENKSPLSESARHDCRHRESFPHTSHLRDVAACLEVL